MALTATASLVLYFLLFCLLPIPLSSAGTYVVGGSTGWTTTCAANYSAWAASHALHVGDTVVFRYELQRHNVYIFHHESAFQTCNFTHATMLDRGDTGYFKWTATRPGIFYFSCNGPTESGSTTHCQRGQKVALRVYGEPHEGFHGAAPQLSPAYAPAPNDRRLKIPRRAGSPARSPRRSPRASTWVASVSSPSPSPVPMPPVLPDFSKGIPFISSNPALPLPKGETDAATIRPLPTSSVEGQAVGWREIQILLLGLLLYSVTVYMFEF